MASTTTIELNTDYQSAERFPAWMALSVFSAVCLAAFNSQSNADARTAADKWVFSATILSMCFSFFSCLAYLAVRHLFVATIPEICFVCSFCRCDRRVGRVRTSTVIAPEN
jgi:ABC-type multidrug transport system permease subunit